MKAADASIDGETSLRPTIAIVATALLAVFVCASTGLGIVRSWLVRSEGAPRRFAFAGVLGIASAGTMDSRVRGNNEAE